MKKGKNIEKFLKNKLEHLDYSFQNDWNVFEQKLSRALFFHRLRQFAFWGSTSLVLFFFVSNPQQVQLFPPSIAEEISFREKVAQNERVKPEETFVVATEKFVAEENPVQAPAQLINNTVPKQSAPSQTTQPIKLNISDEMLFSINDYPDPEIPVPKKLKVKEPDSDLFVLDVDRKEIIKPVKKVQLGKSKDNGPYISPLQSANPWSISVNVYPNFSFRKFKIDKDKIDFLHRDFVDAVETAEGTGFSYNVGVEISKRIGAVTYINGGVEYISYKTEAQFDFFNFREENIDPQTGKIIGYTLKENPEQIQLADENVYHYINFPLTISYQPWASNHVRLNIEAGGSLLYFAQASGKTLDYKTLEFTDLSQQKYRNYIGSLCFKVGANYYVSERVNIGFEPTLVYFTNTIYTKDYPFYVIPYSVGLNFNLQIKLN